MTAVTPGQAERCALEDAIRERVSADCMDDPCQFCDSAVEALMPLADAYAQAAIAAQQPQPAGDETCAHLTAEILRNADGDFKSAEEAPEYVAEAYVRHLEGELARLKDAHPEQQPAPELAATRETLAEVLGRFKYIGGFSKHTPEWFAYATPETMARWRSGLPS